MGFAPGGIVLSFYGGRPSATVGEVDRAGCVGRGPSLRAIKVDDIYPGIDVLWYWRDGCLEYDLVVGPGADIADIRLVFPEAEKVGLSSGGGLYIASAAGNMRHSRPVAWEWDVGSGSMIPVHVEYCVHDDGSIGFRVSRCDRHRLLVIDPKILFSTYSGGVDREAFYALAVGPSGSVYLAGEEQNAGQKDVLIRKYDSSCSNVVYTTVLAGSGDDVARGVAIGPDGSAYVCGYTYSTDFPVLGAYCTTNSGGADAFVSRISPDGTGVVYSTYIGGSGNDYAWSLAVDDVGEVRVGGFTYSADFPLLRPLQSVLAGGAGDSDAFLFGLESNGATLVFSTYLGGGDREHCYGLSWEPGGQIYICGDTRSTDFPITNSITGDSVLQETNAGLVDAFVACLAENGTGIVYSTYLGGSDTDYGKALVAVPDGSCVMVGKTSSLDLPVTNAVQETLAGGQYDTDMFIARVDSIGTNLLLSTYCGGHDADIGVAVALGADTDVFFAGYTSSTDLPVRLPVQVGQAGMIDGMFGCLGDGGTSLTYLSYCGGTVTDKLWGIGVSHGGRCFVGGESDSSDYPVTNALQGTLGGAADGVLTEIPDYPLPFLFAGMSATGADLALTWTGAVGWAFTVESATGSIAAANCTWDVAGTNLDLGGHDGEMRVIVPRHSDQEIYRLIAR